MSVYRKQDTTHIHCLLPPLLFAPALTGSISTKQSIDTPVSTVEGRYSPCLC